MKDEATIRERLVFLVNPDAGRKMHSDRIERERKKDRAGLPELKEENSGYGKHGASMSLNSLVGWIVNGGSAEDDIDTNASTLRTRARDLYAAGGLGRSGPATLTTNVVGWGIMPKPKIDSEVLKLSDEAADAWERNALREFRLWANSKECDAERSKDFWTMQQLAFRNELMSGDCFVLFGMRENKRTPYKTTLRILEADRVSTPGSMGESYSTETSTGRIVDGIEIDREGTVLKFHVSNRHPLTTGISESVTWTAIDAVGKDTGMPNMLQIMTHERPEQRRGIPFVAAQIEQIKQLDRYITSELAANVVSAMLTAFITSDADDGKFGMEDAINEDEKVTDDDFHIELAPGAIYNMPPGKKIETINPLRNNAAFKDFVETLFTISGAGVGIPKEVLVKKYESNYTAARGALLDFWREVRVYRTAFNNSFCQPVYEAWLAEAVATGRIEAPGFFDDPAIRQAWCGCMWIGASMGHVDPLKEVKAAQMRIKMHITTEEQEASEYNGNDWANNIRQRKKELSAISEESAIIDDGEEEIDDGEE